METAECGRILVVRQEPKRAYGLYGSDCRWHLCPVRRQIRLARLQNRRCCSYNCGLCHRLDAALSWRAFAGGGLHWTPCRRSIYRTVRPTGWSRPSSETIAVGYLCFCDRCSTSREPRSSGTANSGKACRSHPTGNTILCKVDWRPGVLSSGVTQRALKAKVTIIPTPYQNQFYLSDCLRMVVAARRGMIQARDVDPREPWPNGRNRTQDQALPGRMRNGSGLRR